MPPRKKRVVVPGSERRLPKKSRAAKPANPAERIQVTVRLRASSDTPRGRAAHALDSRAALALSAALPAARSYLTRDELASQRGASAHDIQRVEGFAAAHGLTVAHVYPGRRTIMLSGTIAALANAFRVKMRRVRMADGTVQRCRGGAITVPAELAKIVVGVFGLDNRPVATPHYRRLADMPSRASRTNSPAKRRRPARRNASDGSFTPPEVAALYNFPTGATGARQCIAIIELNSTNGDTVTGTGYKSSDLAAYFKRLKIPMPQVVAVSVDGGANMPGPDENADGEVVLDIEVAGSIAPDARLAVYFAPNTDQGFLDAVNQAVHDSVRKPTVISISWGGPEDSWTAQSRRDFDQSFQDAAALGITVCAASGDNGSADEPTGRWDGKPHVDFPASSPYALGCGGTKLMGAGSTIESEVTWNEGTRGGATGGGVSRVFARPDYQRTAKVPKSPSGTVGRGVPDVAGDADPATGYQVLLNGQAAVYGGTSAVAPLWAGLIARLNEKLPKPVGFLNPLLYGPLLTSGALRDITDGNNDIDGRLKGTYAAGKGWDACTGLGSCDGTKLFRALGGSVAKRRPRR